MTRVTRREFLQGTTAMAALCAVPVMAMAPTASNRKGYVAKRIAGTSSHWDIFYQRQLVGTIYFYFEPASRTIEEILEKARQDGPEFLAKFCADCRAAHLWAGLPMYDQFVPFA